MRKVILAGACRTPVGVMGGALSTLSAAELGAIVIKEALRRSGIRSEQVDEVYMGCVIQAGQKPNVARQSAMGAGISVEVPATTLNVLCGSGLHSVNTAAKLVAGGFADIIVAGGTESMSTAPYLVTKGRYGYRMGDGVLEDSLLHDALTDPFCDYHMGITAENIAKRWGLTREELDRFAAWSQEKCARAMGEGRFRDEIVPVEVRSKKGIVMVEHDEGPRSQTTEASLAALKPAFLKGGVVTAGNSSGINDGASAVIVMSEAKAVELKVTGMGRWLGGELTGVDPAIMGIGPVAATQKLFQRLGMTMEEIDLIEANEAFAAQSLAVARELHFDREKLNVNGGAVALGHPVGNSGCRILVTLLHEMRRRDAKVGLATLCIGGGMGCSAVVQR